MKNGDQMFSLKIGRLNFVFVIYIEILATCILGCSPAITASPASSKETSLPAMTATTQCEEELILPQITEVQPAQAKPGSEIQVTGSGGYVRDSCGGYFEGARTFELYLDHEPFGEIFCYVNRCEGKRTLPNTLSTGRHCLSVEADKCQFEFHVAAE